MELIRHIGILRLSRWWPNTCQDVWKPKQNCYRRQILWD